MDKGDGEPGTGIESVFLLCFMMMPKHRRIRVVTCSEEVSRPIVQILCGDRIQKHPEKSVKRDPITGLNGDNRNTTFVKLQQDLEANKIENDRVQQNLKAKKK